jgi:uncharacterized protein YecT (DUF1311 family)
MRIRRDLCLLSIVAGSLWATAALADWVVFGAATKCDPGRELAIVGIVEASSDDSIVAPPQDFLGLDDGEHELSCMIGNVLVSATVHVVPPQARGMCMGAGYVSVDKFNVGGVPLFLGGQSFNWNCPPSEKPLMNISVSLRDSRLRVELCYASWDWGTRYETPKCSQENTERFRASFDCTQSTTAIEKLICNSETLSRLDHDLFAVYQEAMRFQKSAVPLRKAQRQWLQQERGSCTDEPCLRKTYEKRIVQIRSLIPKIDSNKAVY